MQHLLRIRYGLMVGLIALVVAGLPIQSWAGFTSTRSAESVAPTAGKWQTWLLKSGSELRPAAPPDKATTDLEIKDLQKLMAQRDAKTVAQIAFWDAGSPSYR